MKRWMNYIKRDTTKKDIERIVIGYTAKSDNSKIKISRSRTNLLCKINKQWKTLDEWLNINNQVVNSGKEGLVDGL